MAVKTTFAGATPSYGNTDNAQPAADQSQASVGGFNLSALWVAGQFARKEVTPEIREYLKVVEEGVTSAMASILRTDTKEFRRIDLADPTGAQAWVVTVDGHHYASIQIFADILTPFERIMPESMRVRPALAALKAEIKGEVALINSYVLRKDDLQFTSQMAGCLTMDMAPVLQPGLNMTIPMLGSDGLEFAVDTRMESVRAIARRLSPHALLPRMDMGFVVTMRTPRDRNQMYQGQQLSENTVPFLVVGAYTEICGPYRDQQNQSKFVPSIRRTAIYSTVPSLAALIIADVLSGEYFVRRGMWMRYYTKFQKNTPNLGQLLPSPTDASQPWFAEDLKSMTDFVNENFLQPMLVTEINEGAYRIPDICMFSGSPEDTNDILNGAAKMFNVATPTGVPAPTVLMGVEYNGSYGDAGGNRRDTREITYLDEVAQRGTVDKATTDILLNYTVEPENKASLISHLAGPTCQFDNETKLVAIQPAYISWLARLIPNSVRLVDADGAQSTFTQVGNYMDSLTNYSGMINVMYQSTRTPLGANSYMRRWV